MIKKMYKINNKLVGIKIENDKFFLHNLKGKTIEKSEFVTLIQKYYKKEIVKGIELTKNRVHPFKVRKRIGMSGCVDTWIEYVKGLNDYYQSDFHIIHRGGNIHISMERKLNKGINGVWLGDLVELINFSTPFNYETQIEEVKVIDNFEGFQDSKYLEEDFEMPCEIKCYIQDITDSYANWQRILNEFGFVDLNGDSIDNNWHTMAIKDEICEFIFDLSKEKEEDLTKEEKEKLSNHLSNSFRYLELSVNEKGAYEVSYVPEIKENFPVLSAKTSSLKEYLEILFK